MSTADLPRARTFWVEHLGCHIVEEQRGEYFLVDASGLKVCIDVDTERRGPSADDPVIAFGVTSIGNVVAALRSRGVEIVHVDVSPETGKWAEIHDPDGRTILLTETG